jgi:hypothetical protein
MTVQSAPISRPDSARWQSGSMLANLLVASVFLLIFYLQLWHHDLWRDEINAFAITWDSPNLPSLFHHIHYEGHPWLWYVILWILSRFTHSIVAMKVLQGCIGTAIILLLSFRSPFRTWEKALILCGYFISFEYTVISRMYGVLLLLLLLYLWQRTNRPANPVAAAILLGLMASTDSTGILLSAALLLEYACAAHAQRRSSPLFSLRSAVSALAVYVAITLVALWSAKPKPDVSVRTTGRVFAFAGQASHLFEAFIRYTVFAFLSVKSPRSDHFWNPELHRGSAIYTLPALLILGMLYLTFRRYRSLLLLMAVSLIGSMLFGHLIYMGYARHYGVNFLAFLAGIWMLRAWHPSLPLPWPAYVLLAISALSGVWAGISVWRRPFTNSRIAADWVRDQHLDQMPLVGVQDTSAVEIAEYLHRPIYMIECSCVDTYLLFSARRDNYTAADAPGRILAAERFYHDVPLLFVAEDPLLPAEQEKLEQEGLRVQPLKSFEGAEEGRENFFFYQLSPQSSPSTLKGYIPPSVDTQGAFNVE